MDEDCIFKDIIEVMVICLLIAMLAFAAGYYGAKYTLPTKDEHIKALGEVDRRNIAIDYACRPHQQWQGMRQFCGSVMMDSRK